MYMTGFSMPYICSPLKGQRVDLVEIRYPEIKNLELSDVGEGNQEIEILIGADYYWAVVDGEIQRCNDEGLVVVVQVRAVVKWAMWKRKRWPISREPGHVKSCYADRMRRW